MEALRRHRNALANLGALLLPLGLAGLLVPFRSSFTNAAAALVLVAVIVAVAVIGNRTAGFLATVSATVWFDFFLTRPFERFQITHRPDIETAVSLFVVGLVVTELAARNRHHHHVATEQSDYVGLIYGFSELLASGAPAARIIEAAGAELAHLLYVRSCRYEPGASERATLRIEHDGAVILGDRLWEVDQLGLPGPKIELPIQRRGQTLGRFVLTPSPGTPVPLQRRVVAVALADQVGSVLTAPTSFGLN
jgi:K+-sensing histidine kinase KdpD